MPKILIKFLKKFKYLICIFCLFFILYFYAYCTHNIQRYGDYQFQNHFINKIEERKNFNISELLNSKEHLVCFIAAYGANDFLYELDPFKNTDLKDKQKIKGTFGRLFANTDGNWWILTFTKESKLINIFRLNRTKFYPAFLNNEKPVSCVNKDAKLSFVPSKDDSYKFNIKSEV